MDSIFDSIQVALGDGATDDERARGAAACRALAEVLERPPVIDVLDTETVAPVPVPAPPPMPPAVAPASAAPPPSPLSFAGPNPFSGLTAEQILDLAIARLRTAVGEDKPMPPTAGTPVRIQLVPVPRRT